MGFLDSSTNNIILDAVVTDTGRQFLSRNDGSFSIVKFAIGDDEINYGIITKYGRTVGKEKIEKNTPVFEALTNPSQALKYKLASFSNSNLLRLPNLSLSGDSYVDAAASTITLGERTQKSSTVKLEQVIQNQQTLDSELQDQMFIVDVPNLFVQVLSNTPENVDGNSRATYLIKNSSINSQSGAVVEFTLTKKSISDAMYTVYGTTANKSRIKSYIRVTGMQSGAVKDITLYLDKSI